jgi:hypothetical protein
LSEQLKAMTFRSGFSGTGALLSPRSSHRLRRV